MGFDMRTVDHLRLGRSTALGKRPEQALPDATLGPPREAVVDCRGRAVLLRAILPTAAALQYVHDAADDPSVIDPLLAPNVGRQIRFDPHPLLVAQPKQVASHLPCSWPARNHQAILPSTTLLGFDPSYLASTDTLALRYYGQTRRSYGSRQTSRHLRRDAGAEGPLRTEMRISSRCLDGGRSAT